jgi:hypothetical protein
MPEATDATLTPTQKNEITKLIVEFGPPLQDFYWTEKEQSEYPFSISMYPRPYVVTELRHRPTQYYCSFGAHTMTASPGFKKKVEEDRHEDDWQTKVLTVTGWLIRIKEETEAPDLFATYLSSAHVHLDQATTVANKLTSEYMHHQIRRMTTSMKDDPELAIGTAKEFLEGVCQTILTERQVPVTKSEDFPGLVKLTINSLTILPDGLVAPQVEKTVTVLLKNLGSIAHQLAEIRNAFGTGHGKQSEHVGLLEHHARLAAGTAVTLAVFLHDCHLRT